MHKNVVLIPTYNEAESIGDLLTQLKNCGIDVIVIDDDSPDGTAKIVKNMGFDWVRLMENGKKKGIGPAYVTAMGIAIAAGYKKIATMDADGSHLVSDLEKMFVSAQDFDVVMGTRWMPEGSVSNWDPKRIYLSKFGNWFARISLALPYRDLTGGLRVYDAKRLEMLNLERIRSNGYCFQIEMIKALYSLDAKIKEVPIHFVERREGVSKMSQGIVAEAFVRVSVWGIKRMLRINADNAHYVK